MTPLRNLDVLIRLAGVSTLLATGCSFGESGVPPPMDRLFLPTGIAVDPTSDWLYVVNSNFDLRFNAGTVTAVDLRKTAEDRRRTDWGVCPPGQFVPSDKDPTRFCCRDLLERGILNCNERGYIDGRSTVRIGSFGGAVRVQTLARTGEPARRLYVAVRAEPSITFIDATLTGNGVTLRCQDGELGKNHLCEDGWKVRLGGPADGTGRLPEEPYALVIDDKLKALYVGHLFEGVSSIDLCGPKPRLAGIAQRVFAHPAQGVTTMTLSDPDVAGSSLLATGAVGVVGTAAAEVRTLFLGDASATTCPADPTSHRDLTLVPGEGFYSSAFFPGGKDIRGVIPSPDGRRLYLLHRNDRRNFGRDPASVVAVDRTPDAAGNPANRAVDAVEVCAGGMEMAAHDSGRGARLFVVCFESGQLYVVDPVLFEVTAIINAGRGPNTLVFPSNDRTVAYMGGFTDNSVSVIDLAPGSPTEYRVVQRIGFPHVKGR
jgi:DNA-binding beta-propeller fold protein YncE